MAESYDNITPMRRRLHAELWAILHREARGCDQAIPTWALAERMGVPEREVRQLKRELVILYRRPIGSSTGKTPGLYVITAGPAPGGIAGSERIDLLVAVDDALAPTLVSARHEGEIDLVRVSR